LKSSGILKSAIYHDAKPKAAVREAKSGLDAWCYSV